MKEDENIFILDRLTTKQKDDLIELIKKIENVQVQQYRHQPPEAWHKIFEEHEKEFLDTVLPRVDYEGNYYMTVKLEQAQLQRPDEEGQIQCP